MSGPRPRPHPPDGGDDEGVLCLRPEWYLLLIMAVALALRLFNYVGRSLWTDEFSTYWVATAPTWRECALRAAETQGMSPFYFFLERLVLSVLPHAEWSLRGLSLLASLAAIWAAYAVAVATFRDEQTGLVAALILALHEVHIYYAQEARPYALAMLCALLCQWWYLRWLRRGERADRLGYALAGICMLFCHYLFLPLLLAQNAWYLYLRRKGGKAAPAPSLRDWGWTQATLSLALFTQLVQAWSMLEQRAQWNWLPPMTVKGMARLMAVMLDWQIFALLVLFFLVFRLTEHLPIRESLRRRRDEAVLLGLWLAAPVACLYVISLAGGISLLDDRYLVLTLLAFQLLLARFLCSFRSSIMRTTMPGAYVVLYLGFVLIPNYSAAGHFSRRLRHEYDWRGAMAFLAENHEPGDVVMLRCGEIKENWVPLSDNPRIRDYVRAPFHSFYWRGRPLPEIVTMTYSMEPRFTDYYERVFTAAVARPRTWLIGVDPPNTNYPISYVLPALERHAPITRYYEADFSGVYLALFSGQGGNVAAGAPDAAPPPEDEPLAP